MPAPNNQESPNSALQHTENVINPILPLSASPEKQVPQSSGSIKKIAIALFTLLILVGGVGAGVFLVKKQQELRELASSAAECTQSPNCVVFEDPGDSGFREVDNYIDYMMITHKPGEEARFEQGESDDGCYRVEINQNQLRWERYSSGNTCREISNIQVWMGGPPQPTQTPTPTPTTPPPASCNQSCTSSLNCEEGLECINKLCRNPDCGEEKTCICPEPTATPTDPPTQITAICNEVNVYDTSWNLLSSENLKKLKSGDTVRFSVSGSTTQGAIEKARFIINKKTTQEVTDKKPGTKEFYVEYEIPEGELDFTVNGEIYHSNLGWF